MTSSSVVTSRPAQPTPPSAGPSRAAAARGVLRRTLALGVLACIVASFGLTAGTRAEADRPRTFSEQALNEAYATARSLADTADQLAGAGTAAAELAEQAALLREQALVLASPGGTAAYRARESGPVPEQYPDALYAAARTNLEAAGRADYGTARLLASVGTSQLLLAGRAGEALDQPVDLPDTGGTTHWTPVLEDDAARCTDDGGGRSELRDRPGPAEALQAALQAEFGAVYAYEVAQARSSEDLYVLGQGLPEGRARHLDAGRRGVDLLPLLCLPATDPLPAYSLSPAFSADPAQALAEMETAFPAVYADLAGSSDGAIRSWAIDRLVETSAALAAGAGNVPATPGLEAEPAELPWAAD